MKDQRKEVELYFRTKYPERRYVMSNCYTIEDISGNGMGNTIVVEFYDMELGDRGKMELIIKMYELISFISHNKKGEEHGKRI